MNMDQSRYFKYLLPQWSNLDESAHGGGYLRLIISGSSGICLASYFWASQHQRHSLFIAHEHEFRKIHELPLLLKTCLSKDPSFATLRQDCKYLTTYYVEPLYPVHWLTHFSREETQKAFQAASQIRSLVENKLGFS